MNFLDTYVLIEVYRGNEQFFSYFEETFVINDLILIEFFWVLLREISIDEAKKWYVRLEPYSQPVKRETLVKAMLFRKEHKPKNLSFFDCVGYIYAQEHLMYFVTGDKEFKDMTGVVFTS